MSRFLPSAEGLYHPSNEHDSCGIGFVAHFKGKKENSIVSKAIQLLLNLEHRGAVGSEYNSGDGAGIIIQIPHEFFVSISDQFSFALPEEGDYAVGQCFFPSDFHDREKCRTIFAEAVSAHGQILLGWRPVPNNNSALGKTVLKTQPYMEQVFIKKSLDCSDQEEFERKLFVIRCHAESQIVKILKEKSARDYYICSLSSRTVVYKGQLITSQLLGFFDDLQNPLTKSALGLVHSRFSTNTAPAWPLSQPFRYLAHNGEINTLRGNINWMNARESLFESKQFTQEELEAIKPVIDLNNSDSGVLDNVVEFLRLEGRPLSEVMLMLIPQAWEKDQDIDAQCRLFYEFHSMLMEPWDGPASVAFTDGISIGAILDRNGLRPSRYCITKDDIVVMSSEQGSLEIPPSDIVLKGRLKPGQIFVIDLEKGVFISNAEIKKHVSQKKDYAKLLKNQKIKFDDYCSQSETSLSKKKIDKGRLCQLQRCFGYTTEEFKFLLRPMFQSGYEAIGSMGNDSPLAVFSNTPTNLFNYFHQLFAQVTNPPIDPIRENMVMSLRVLLGCQGNILNDQANRFFFEFDQPILTNEKMEELKRCDGHPLKIETISMLFEVGSESSLLESALENLCSNVCTLVRNGAQIIILSDRNISATLASIPSLLAVSAVHHRLIQLGLRGCCGLVVETGETREVHHFALLLGYGASLINPYLVLDSVSSLTDLGYLDETISQKKAESNYIHAVGKGLFKIMSKMGISTLQSYTGAQLFEAIGLSEPFVEKYFTGTFSRLSGVSIDIIQQETLMRHSASFNENPSDTLEEGGYYQWRKRGEKHLFSPEVIHLLQRSTRQKDYQIYKQFTEAINNQQDTPCTLRALLDFDFSSSASIDLDEVESVASICRRFATGAMSLGSISEEAHTTLAIAMNRIGGRSNTGEGGEDPKRFQPLANGDNACSAIKQVASGRFGVTLNYLIHSNEIQIKIAQGAKPGEGGQLPGHKVNEFIGKIRHSTPGVGLISPPPHHDIYSIEDLAQLIFDLKNASRDSRISVKLVSEVGVGTIAAGVAKAHADVILISGYDGGTGASPQTSIKHAGIPWELGLAETHQVLLKNNLRTRVVLQTDGQIRTGKDLAVASLLGAEEWGIASAALVTLGCIMMRKCHLNTCPVGIATQDQDLRKLYHGQADYVVNYLQFMAQDLREIMASLGFRTVEEMVGRVDKLKTFSNITHWKAKTLSFNKLLHNMDHEGASYCVESQDHQIDKVLDLDILRECDAAIQQKYPTRISTVFRNFNRTVGTILSSEITKKYGSEGLPDDTIHVYGKGSAGQSFGAFLVPGITLEVEGDANDYFGKGLCGGRLILYPPKEAAHLTAFNNVILGNVAFYGATGGTAYIAGMAGERFCVRNSGASVVVESVGDHCCEYMTGGRVVILGQVGCNFGAGMSGGIAYIFDEMGTLQKYINTELVDIESSIENSEEIRNLIQAHYDFTGSERAQQILSNWAKNLKSIIQIMPRDYKRVLLKKKQLSNQKKEA